MLDVITKMDEIVERLRLNNDLVKIYFSTTVDNSELINRKDKDDNIDSTTTTYSTITSTTNTSSSINPNSTSIETHLRYIRDYIRFCENKSQSPYPITQQNILSFLQKVNQRTVKTNYNPTHPNFMASIQSCKHRLKTLQWICFCALDPRMRKLDLMDLVGVTFVHVIPLKPMLNMNLQQVNGMDAYFGISNNSDTTYNQICLNKDDDNFGDENTLSQNMTNYYVTSIGTSNHNEIKEIAVDSFSCISNWTTHFTSSNNEVSSMNKEITTKNDESACLNRLRMLEQQNERLKRENQIWKSYHRQIQANILQDPKLCNNSITTHTTIDDSKFSGFICEINPSKLLFEERKFKLFHLRFTDGSKVLAYAEQEPIPEQIMKARNLCLWCGCAIITSGIILMTKDSTVGRHDWEWIPYYTFHPLTYSPTATSLSYVWLDEIMKEFQWGTHEQIPITLLERDFHQRWLITHQMQIAYQQRKIVFDYIKQVTAHLHFGSVVDRQLDALNWIKWNLMKREYSFQQFLEVLDHALLPKYRHVFKEDAERTFISLYAFDENEN